MSNEHKSDHYKNRRNGVHYTILQSLPKPLRLSKVGKAYWRRVVLGEYSHFHCDPNGVQCIYCRDNTNLSRLDKLRYAIEKVI